MTIVGEALIDIVDGATHEEIPGGSPANVALGLGRLGVRVDFITWLADDERGRRIATHLAESDVALEHDVFGASRTSTATVSLSEDGQPRYTFDIDWDPPVRTSTPQRLHVGSIGAFLQPGAAQVQALVQRTAAAGGVVSLDPNVRPALLPGRAAARKTFEQLASHSDIVKLSDEDAAWLYPGSDVGGVLDRLSHLGVGLGVVTAGAYGSTLAAGDHRVFVPAATTDVVDTVGAGDSYMAALLWTLDPHSSDGADLALADVQRIGSICSRAASITVGRSGADLPWAKDLGGVTAVRSEV